MRVLHVVTAATVLGTLVIVGVAVHGHFNRFVTANSGDGMVYVIDRRTGEAAIMSGGSKFAVAEFAEDEGVDDPFSEALRLARLYHESDAFRALAESGGTYEVLPWRVYQSSEQAYFVVFRVILDGAEKEKCFEVNLITRNTRVVDEALPSLRKAYKSVRDAGVFWEFSP